MPNYSGDYWSISSTRLFMFENLIKLLSTNMFMFDDFIKFWSLDISK